ncbi:Leukotriene A4 hydrolase, C-terminal [Nocardioides exalbidus]|uniref:Aminopeptidase N n=1 Tax=Nocardioides exalbidus TaxID=402596 RepID=A0A1H4WLH6_9ACTN|nr:M1 family metallopeptidase [Nocardioides exalbidus]SEC93940.1 Leukotriene A4 hydrolase, C-terminal [Nocardioides exalbidus]
MDPRPHDPHSCSRPDEVAVRHLSLDLDVDLTAQRLSGSVTLSLDHLVPGAPLVLDTWRLEVARVTGADGADLPFTIGTHDDVVGSPLTVETGGADHVVVHYATGADANALQWLGPEQTSSGKPFLFTQSQPILARTWIPCQDSPGVRTTYDADVRVPGDLLALMSAENPTSRAEDGRYRFTMREPVPSYLIALAVGDLEHRDLGPRSGVYAEPGEVDAAAWEFADTERMIDAAERLYGPYRWGRYDLLVLPPSFPYGGMENPRLTFATPTVVAGDRSLVSLVAHELAHSWSGNLVTNATWNDVWLNEGFTTYFERRIDEEVFGVDTAAMLLTLGRQELDRALVGVDPRQTWLEQDVVDPDDGPPRIPYEKGSLFLRMLETAVGRDRFDAFLRDYFDRFAFTTMDTAGFVAHLTAELLDPAGLTADDVRLEEWVHGPGVPGNEPPTTSAALEQVDAQVAALLAGSGVAELDTDGWVSQQWVRLVRALPDDTDHAVMADLDAAFGFTGSGNIEVATSWFEKTVLTGYAFRSPAVDAGLEDLLTRHGRALYLRHVYEALASTDAGRDRATEIYARARPTYHPVSQAVVDRVLGLR